MRRVSVKSFAALLLIVAAVATANDNYPGLPPDCWSEPRNVHSGHPDSWELLDKNLAYSHVSVAPEGKKEFSPNKGYYFVTEGFRGDSSVAIFSEKEEFWKLAFKEVFYGADPKWINENLLFIRVYWGRIALQDIIVNVEQEKIIYTESGGDEYIAFNQFKEGCKSLGGCQCIEKEQPHNQ